MNNELDPYMNAGKKFVIPSLVISSFAIFPAAFATTLLLLEISESFGITLGVSGLLQTASNTVSIVFALILSALSLKFSSRSLLLTGLGAIIVSSLGCGLTSNFSMMLIFYGFTGIGSAIIMPMGFTLVAQHIPVKKRPQIIGWIIAGATLSGVIGLPIIGFISNNYGWRMAYLGYALPLAALALIISAVGLPTLKNRDSQREPEENIFESYQYILKNKSACACLLNSVLVMIAWQAADLYSSALYRERFLLSLGSTSMLLTITSLVFSITSIASGKFVERFGRKPIAVYALFISGLMVTSFTVLPNLYFSMASRLLASLFVSLTYNAFSGLTLDQIPQFRGTMMSINQAAGSLGAAIGAVLGGVVYTIFGYVAIGPVHGSLMIVGSLILRLFVIDTIKNE